MAENNTLTQTTVLNVETVKAVNSVKDLRDNIAALKKVVNEAKIDSDEYREAQQELAAQQNALREIQKGSAASIEKVTKAAKGLGTSYAALSNRMSQLRAEYRTTEDDMERNRLAKQIKEINDQLKEMDASRGVFSRNVGDYANQMSKGFATTAGAAASVINPIKNVKAGMDALSATPVIAILGIVANLLNRLVESFRSNEETMNAFRRAMAPVDAMATKFKVAIQDMAAGLAKLVDWAVKATTAVAKFLGYVKKEDLEAAKVHREIIDDEIALTEQRRANERANAEAASRVADLRAKAAEKDKYTAKERLEFLQKAGDEEKAIAARNKQLAQDEYDLLKRKADLAGNSAEENEELNRAYIRLVETNTAYNNKLRELNGQMATATKEMKAQAKAAQEAADKIRALAELSDDIDLSGLDELEKINDKLVIPEDKWAERAKLMQENIDRETERQIKKNILLIEDEKQRADEEVRIRMEAEERKLDVLREAEANTTDPLAKIELQQQIADMELDIDVKKNQRLKKLNEEAKAERLESLRSALSVMSDIASGTASLMDSIADSMDVTNAKEFKRQQNLQVASATINMLSGVATAISSAMTLGPIMGPIMGALNSATVLAAGTAQIRKIKQQKYNSASAPDTAAPAVAVNPPNIQTQLPTVATLTGAKEEERLNRMASPVRAYIVDSELQAKEAQRKTIEDETSF